MREPVKCYNWFKEEFKQQTNLQTKNLEINLQMHAELNFGGWGKYCPSMWQNLFAYV